MKRKQLLIAATAFALTMSTGLFADQKRNDGRGTDDGGKAVRVADDNLPKQSGEGKGHPVRVADDNLPKHSGEGKGHPVRVADDNLPKHSGEGNGHPVRLT